MSDWFSTALEMQRTLIRAQDAQWRAAQAALDAGRQVTVLQEAGQRAAEANVAAWRHWAQLWGWK